MTDEDIVRAVRSIRYGSKSLRCARRALSVRALAKAADINPLTIYKLCASGRMHPTTADKLRCVLGPSSLGADMLTTGEN